MPWKYNPFTDALDQTGSGGASYIDGVVADPTALPVTLGTPALDSVYLAKAGSGVWLINRRPAGLYCRVANNGNANDWQHLGAFPEVNADGNWELYNSTDPTKELKFDLSAIATGTTRTISVPDKNITLDDAGDSRTPTSHASSHASTGSDPLAPSDIGAAASNHTHILATDIATALAEDPDLCRESLNLGDMATEPSSNFSQSSHTHGNLTNDGKLGTAAGLPVVTTTAGAVTTLALGTANQVLRVNSGATGVEFADPAASGVTGAASSASDVLGVSGSNITGVDANADRIIFWDDSEGRLRHLEVSTGLSLSGTTLTATGGGATNLFIPASAFIPRSTTGAGVDSREIGATNRTNWDELLFDTGTQEFAQATVVMPSNYNYGTISARFYWTCSTAPSGSNNSIVMGIRGRAFGDNVTLDAAMGAGQQVADTVQTINFMHVTSATPAVTIDGTPAANKAVQFEIYRVPADSSDNYGFDLRLLGVEIIFN